MASPRLCSIDGCGKRAKGRGWCGMHLWRFHKHGDPDATLKLPNGTIRAWLEQNINFAGGECLIWPFHRDKKGRARMGGVGAGNAAREMCRMRHGEPPSSKHHAAHTCGKAHDGCVSPRHLYWATAKRNAEDRTLHGVETRGSDMWKAKLTEADVIEIRALDGTMPRREIGARYGVKRQCIDAVCNRRSWAWLE